MGYKRINAGRMKVNKLIASFLSRNEEHRERGSIEHAPIHCKIRRKLRNLHYFCIQIKYLKYSLKVIFSSRVNMLY